MINKYFAGNIPMVDKTKNEQDEELEAFVLEKVKQVEENMESIHVSNALQEIWNIIARSNKYIDETAPWALAKSEEAEDKEKLASCMYHLAENLRIVAILLQPFMKETSQKMLEQLGINEQTIKTWDSTKTYGAIKEQTKVIEKGEPLFMRLDMEEEVNYIKEKPKGIGNSITRNEKIKEIKEVLNMDEKHRQYCIKLGNPYMREERYQEQFKASNVNSSWIPENKVENPESWFKNKKNNF